MGDCFGKTALAMTYWELLSPRIQQFPIWLRRIAKSCEQGADLTIRASKSDEKILI
jgi:hypothetical protein